MKGKALLGAFGLEKEVEEEESLRNNDFLIIFCKASIISSCFAYIASITTMTADVTALVIKCSTAGFIEL